MIRWAGLAMSAVLMGAAIGCSPVMQNHGYAPDDALLADIQVGQDTKGSVRRKVGRPGTNGVFDSTGWYYVASTVRHYTYHEPEVVDRRVVAIEFDSSEIVTSVNTYGLEDGKIIDLQTRTTPTHGRQLTIMQQILGNIGKITGEDVLQE